MSVWPTRPKGWPGAFEADIRIHFVQLWKLRYMSVNVRIPAEGTEPLLRSDPRSTINTKKQQVQLWTALCH